MEIQRLNRSDPERIFMTFMNSNASSITAGHWAGIDFVTDQDGVGVDKPQGINRNKIVGVSMTTLAAGAYGKFQIWGYHGTARARGGTQVGTNDLTAGAALAFSTSAWYPQRYQPLSAANKSEYGKQGALGHVFGAVNTAANYSAATSSTYNVFITCL